MPSIASVPQTSTLKKFRRNFLRRPGQLFRIRFADKEIRWVTGFPSSASCRQAQAQCGNTKFQSSASGGIIRRLWMEL
jgi:hypothetical protein